MITVITEMNHGPTMNQLQEISLYTYDLKHFRIVIDVLTQKLAKYRQKHSQDFKSIIRYLTLILYLLQNGSDYFVSWMKDNHHSLETDLNKLIDFNNHSHNKHDPIVKDNMIIHSKLKKIIQLCTDDQSLKKFRLSIYRYRNDMNSPGIKRTSLDDIGYNDIIIN